MKRILLLLASLSCVFIHGQNSSVRYKVAEASGKESDVVMLLTDLESYRVKDSISLQHWLGDRGHKLQRIDEQGFPIYYSTNNSVSRELSKVNQISADLGKQGLYGEGIFIAVLDADVALNVHQEFMGARESRVVLRDSEKDIFAIQSDKGRKDAEDDRNHATHVTGTIASAGSFDKSSGIAPLASVLSYRWDDDYTKIAALGKEGVLVSNHSYGIAVVDDSLEPLLPESYFGTYNRDAEIFDRVAHTFPYYLPVVAAGNSQQYAHIVNPSKKKKDLLVGFSNAKNVLVVGAITAYGGSSGGNVETRFSSYGPTNDFRVKPDVVASGEDIVSTAYERPDNVGAKQKVNRYMALSGTSMATPAVSGIIGLWQEWAIKTNKFPYKSATMRGIASLTSEYLEDFMGPSYRYGWGLINAEEGIRFLENVKDRRALLEESVLWDKKTYTEEIEIDSQTTILSVVLAWTDVAGENKIGKSMGKHVDIINDLDLRVYFREEEFLPWKLRESFDNPLPERGDNKVDNIERIDIKNPRKGTYKVVVSHKGALVDARQDFSLLAMTNDGLSLNRGDVFVSNQTKELSFNVWPNPVQSTLYVNVPKDVVFSSNLLALYDSGGRFLKDIEVKSTDFYKINVEELTAGMYFLKIKGDGKAYSVKFIKK